MLWRAELDNSLAAEEEGVGAVALEGGLDDEGRGGKEGEEVLGKEPALEASVVREAAGRGGLTSSFDFSPFCLHCFVVHRGIDVFVVRDEFRGVNMIQLSQQYMRDNKWRDISRICRISKTLIVVHAMHTGQP